MPKVLAPIKKQFRNAKKHPKIAIPAVLVTLLLIGGLAALVVAGGGDDGDKSATTATQKKKKGKEDPGIAAAKKRKVKPAPVVNGRGTLDVARREGRLALAQARGRIKNPSGVNVTVSAAPKQMVTVDYQLACYKAVHKQHFTRVKSGRYRTRPPSTRGLAIPLPGADECTATIGAQLTRGTGRIKVSVSAG
ncbi:MAG: hypothetical protein QOI73_1154 [Solirubrobacteraceae bacterium]|nr:hypothetical protein [Solirubrobacteraceae bacterium]